MSRPTAAAIAFSSNRDHGPNLFVAKINGKHVRELTHSRHDCFGSACYTNPSWSPDGKHIAFLASGRYSSSVEVMRADGRGFAKEFDTRRHRRRRLRQPRRRPRLGPRPR